MRNIEHFGNVVPVRDEKRESRYPATVAVCAGLFFGKSIEVDSQ